MTLSGQSGVRLSIFGYRPSIADFRVSGIEWRPTIVASRRSRVERRLSQVVSRESASTQDTRAGFSLVELLIVIVLIAVVATGINVSIGALTRTRLRSACMKVLAASRFAYHRAVTHGTTVRVRLDLENNTVAIEEAHGHVTLARSTDAVKQELDESKEDQAAVDPWEAAQKKLEQPVKPSFGASPFHPITRDDGEVMPASTAGPVGEGIRVEQVFVTHEPNPRKEGTASLYFFPSGYTEHAVVQLADSGGHIYSVEIQPLTGRGRVHTTAYRPKPLRDDASDRETSEVEDRSW